MVVFLCLHVFITRLVGGGCGCVFGLGIESLYERAHCRVHVQHRVSVRHVSWWLPAQPASGVVLLVWVCVVGCL